MSDSLYRSKGGSEVRVSSATHRTYGDGDREKREPSPSDDNPKRQKTDSARVAFNDRMSKDAQETKSVPQKKVAAVALKLADKKPKEPDIKVKSTKSLSVAQAFADDSDSEPEEMPPEAKMRMRNVGRETPTSAGPNSFNKSKQGFINTSRAWRLKKEEEIAKQLHEKSRKEKELNGEEL